MKFYKIIEAIENERPFTPSKWGRLMSKYSYKKNKKYRWKGKYINVWENHWNGNVFYIFPPAFLQPELWNDPRLTKLYKDELENKVKIKFPIVTMEDFFNPYFSYKFKDLKDLENVIKDLESKMTTFNKYYNEKRTEEPLTYEREIREKYIMDLFKYFEKLIKPFKNDK